MTDKTLHAAGRVHPLEDEGLGNASYLVEVGDGLALSVDPPRDADAHLEEADRSGLRIVSVLETHLHADFVSGGREIAERTGAEIVAARDAEVAFPHRPSADGDALRIGETEVRALHTPGHTPEHLSYLLVVDDRPLAIFTGGSLIAGGAARTDLISPDRTEELARAQFHSLRRIAELPDDVTVRPTHGGGSFCSVAPSGPAGTVGDQRRTNPLLGIDDEEVFVREFLSGFGSFPGYFLHLREVNRVGATLLRDLPAPRPIPAERVHDEMGAGSWLVDVRPVSDWARAHAVGSVSIALRPVFASWLGWVVPFGASVVLLGDPDVLDDAVRAARRIGYDRVLGWVDGGLDGWRSAGLPVSSVEEVDADEAVARRDTGAVLLDVRQTNEFDSGRVPGARHLEVGDVAGAADVPGDEVVTYCGHGERAATAASLLEARGLAVSLFTGGMTEWGRLERPVEAG